MALEDDIIKLLKVEGYRINETVRDALDEFIEVLEEEMEGIQGDPDEEKDDDDDE